MLTQTVSNPGAWQACTLDAPQAWYHPLSKRLLDALDEAVREFRRQPRSVTQVVPSAALADCVADVLPALHDLEKGRGFVVLEGIPQGRYSTEKLQLIYWLVGQLLGRPFAQNVEGTLLYDVRDTGQDVRYGARFSVTNAESTFHTDNSFGEDILDYVGLLCLNTAKSGGLSQVVSGHAAHHRLRKQYPDVLELLYQPFHVDRRGGVQPGEAPTVPVPVFQFNGQELLCRYLRYWIEVGHEKAGELLTPAQVHALDTLDAVLADPELRAEFPLKPGDMFYINNRWIFHNRTGFEDHAEPERKRHLVRLWLQTRN